MPGRSVAAEALRPRHAAKLVVTNDDGFSAFFSGKYRTAQDLEQQVRSYADTQVAVLEWCIAAGSRVNYLSHVTELIGTNVKEFPRRGDQLASETLQRLADQGIDPLAVVAATCHAVGIACYASLRMNGDYPASWMGETLPRMMNSNFWWSHPEFRVRGKKGEDRTKLSYAFPEVRAFKLGILREAAERDIDGINLDFLRHPDFFGYEVPMVQAFENRYGIDPRTVPATDPRWLRLRAEIMTGFVRDVRRVLDEAGRRKGRRLGLSVRIDWREYRTWGCDLAVWLEEGLLEYAVVAQRSLGGYEFDLKPFVALARGTGCAILFGEEATVSGHDLTAHEDKLIAEGKMKAPARDTMTLARYQERAARWYAAGADGVHLFNENRAAVLRGLGNVEPAGQK